MKQQVYFPEICMDTTYKHYAVKKSISGIFLLANLALINSCNTTNYVEPTIKIETNFGDILVELYPEKAPKTVHAFLSYIDSGIYKKSSFYRVLKLEDQPSSADKSQLIQGGIYESNPTFLQRQTGIPLETTEQTGLKHENGTISLARTTPNSASTEFFICIGDQPAYNYGGSANPDKQGFAAFGKVIKGMNVVKRIYAQPSEGTSFTPPVLIRNIVYLNSK